MGVINTLEELHVFFVSHGKQRMGFPSPNSTGSRMRIIAINPPWSTSRHTKARQEVSFVKYILGTQKPTVVTPKLNTVQNESGVNLLWVPAF